MTSVSRIGADRMNARVNPRSAEVLLRISERIAHIADGDAVYVASLGNSTVRCLSGEAAEIWHVLTLTGTLQELIRILRVRHPEVEAELIAESTLGFLHELEAIGLIELISQASEPTEP